MSSDPQQFEGYAPVLIQLDETGDAYWVATVHPYFSDQPEYWATKALHECPGSINIKNCAINATTYPHLFPQNNSPDNSTRTLYKML